MSAQEPEALDLGTDPAAQMSAILDFLAPEPDPAPAGEGGPAGGAPAAEPGQQPAADQGAGTARPDAGAPAGGDGGVGAVPADGQPATDGSHDDGAGRTAGAFDATSLSSTWGEITTKIEERQDEGLQQAALEEVRTEHSRYFEAIQQHPRLLVGRKVPSLTGQGEDTLRDTADVREWQDAVKQILVEEIQSRVEARRGDTQGLLTTVHASIDLFRSNPDLVPGARQFDKELADKLTSELKPYEQRSNGKLIGYSVPVQPIVNALRSSLVASRAAKPPAPAAPSAPSAQQQRAAEQPRTPQGRWDAPQTGIPSKAGQSAAGSDDVAGGIMDAFFRQNGFRI